MESLVHKNVECQANFYLRDTADLAVQHNRNERDIFPNTRFIQNTVEISCAFSYAFSNFPWLIAIKISFENIMPKSYEANIKIFSKNKLLLPLIGIILAFSCRDPIPNIVNIIRIFMLFLLTQQNYLLIFQPVFRRG